MSAMEAKFGISLSNRSVLFGWTSLEQILEAAQIAEDSDMFHGVWVGDSFLQKPRLESIVTLSAITMRTRRVKLGTICMASFNYRHPIALAIQWASLDIISEGRTILGICNGPSAKDGEVFARELKAMGIPSHERVSRLEEGVTILRRLWSEEKVTHQGKYYSFEDVELLPKPVQRPLPIFLAVNPKKAKEEDPLIERVLRRVAKYADGWQADTTPAEIVRQRFDRIKQYAEEEGRDPSKLESSVHLMVNINEDPDKAFEEAREYLTLYYPPGYISRERAELWLAYGPPEDVIKKIRSYVEAGCTMPVLRFCSRNIKQQLDRCLKEVFPAFQT